MNHANSPNAQATAELERVEFLLLAAGWQHGEKGDAAGAQHQVGNASVFTGVVEVEGVDLDGLGVVNAGESFLCGEANRRGRRSGTEVAKDRILQHGCVVANGREAGNVEDVADTHCNRLLGSDEDAVFGDP